MNGAYFFRIYSRKRLHLSQENGIIIYTLIGIYDY